MGNNNPFPVDFQCVVLTDCTPSNNNSYAIIVVAVVAVTITIIIISILVINERLGRIEQNA